MNYFPSQRYFPLFLKDKILKRSHIERQKEIKRRTINVPEMSSLPGTLDPVEFARTRTSEVLLLKQEIEQSRMSNSSRRVFQTLPRTMRRRAASFNVKRLPMRLRQRALDEVNLSPFFRKLILSYR